jgi:hypothetical protein
MTSKEDIMPEKKKDDETQEAIKDLLAAFWDNYNSYKAGEMPPSDENFYKAIGAPGPAQYSAFEKLFSMCEDGERVVEKYFDQIYMYDLVDMEKEEPAMLQFVRKLSDRAVYDDPGKNKICFAFGSFWGRHHETRKKIISYLPELYKKGLSIEINAQAKETEEHIANIIDPVKKNSRFGIKTRIPIHFIRTGDFVFFEFPHTESTIIRLNMLLDLTEIAPKQEKSKEQLIRFFDELVAEARG